MKRENSGEGYKVMKRGHEEKNLPNTAVADLKYAQHGMDNEKELRDDVDKLASYVKKHKMKY